MEKMAHNQRLVEQVLGKQNLEMILKDMDAARIDLSKMNSIAAHRDLPEVMKPLIYSCFFVVFV